MRELQQASAPAGALEQEVAVPVVPWAPVVLAVSELMRQGLSTR